MCMTWGPEGTYAIKPRKGLSFSSYSFQPLHMALPRKEPPINTPKQDDSTEILSLSRTHPQL